MIGGKVVKRASDELLQGADSQELALGLSRAADLSARTWNGWMIGTAWAIEIA